MELSIEAQADIEDNVTGEWAYTAVIVQDGLFGLGIAHRDVAGYTPISPAKASYGSYRAACKDADRLNATRGIGKEMAFEIVASSMARKVECFE
jgi:hypothetical protein